MLRSHFLDKMTRVMSQTVTEYTGGDTLFLFGKEMIADIGDNHAEISGFSDEYDLN